MTTFAAIDFETANWNRCSICSIGVVFVENGILTNRFHELVRPAPNYYCQGATDIHGITFWDTRHARAFPEVWNDLVASLLHLPLVAHYSAFDEGCLKAAFAHYNMEYPNYKFHCTCRQSRKVHPKLPNHQLPTVAQHLGINLETHHDALADAEACARIALKIF